MGSSVYVLLLLAAIFIYCSRSICEFEIKIARRRNQGTTLLGFTYRTVNASSLYQCLDVCMRDWRCESFNMKQAVGTKRYICEINVMTMTKVIPGQVVQRNSSDFYNISGAMIAKIFLEGMDQSTQSRGSLHSPGTKMNPGSSCKDLISRIPSLTSGTYWISVLGTLIEVYCDMTVDGGGWTLVWSYTFKKYSDFGNPGNAVTPFPSWSVTGNIGVPTSKKVPLNLNDYNAMEFNKWKEIGSEFLIQSNINNWVSCKPGTGSLVMFKAGTLFCKIEKRIVSDCGHIGPPDKLVIDRYGPSLTKATENKQYYYFEGNTQSSVQNYPVHDPCATTNQGHKKGVTDPRGNIFIR